MMHRFLFRTLCLLLCLQLSLSFTGQLAKAQTSSTDDSSDGVKEFSPIPHLIRDPGIQASLKLSKAQQAEIQQWLTLYGHRLFLLRDATPQNGGREWNITADDLEMALDTVLNPTQRMRLRQLKLQSRGLSALRQPPLSQQLKLTAEQSQAIETVFDTISQQVQAIDQQALDSVAQHLALQQKLHQDVLKVLTPEQQKELSGLIGEPYNMNSIQHNAGRPPELLEISGWVNGEPTTLAKLRGRPVIVYFYQAGDEVSTANMAHIRRLSNKFPRNTVHSLGVHSPVSDEHRTLAATQTDVRRQLMLFPVAFDEKSVTAKAWGNPDGPALYILDAQGNVRFWAYGPLVTDEINRVSQAETVLNNLLLPPAGN